MTVHKIVLRELKYNRHKPQELIGDMLMNMAMETPNLIPVEADDMRM
jgi:hypothetical protein